MYHQLQSRRVLTTLPSLPPFFALSHPYLNFIAFFPALPGHRLTTSARGNLLLKPQNRHPVKELRKVIMWTTLSSITTYSSRTSCRLQYPSFDSQHQRRPSSPPSSISSSSPIITAAVTTTTTAADYAFF